MLMTSKLIKQGYRYHNLSKAFICILLQTTRADMFNIIFV